MFESDFGNEISMVGKNIENATIMVLRKLEYWNNRLDCIRKELARVPRKRLLDKRGFKRLLAKNKQGKHIGEQSLQDFNERFANAVRIPKRYL